jgi:anti-anti-sigma factor
MLAGEFDWAVVGHVEGAIEHARAEPIENIIFDLAELTFLDLAGLRTILRVHTRAESEGISVTVVRPRSLANRVFTVTRAAETLSVVDSA